MSGKKIINSSMGWLPTLPMNAKRFLIVISLLSSAAVLSGCKEDTENYYGITANENGLDTDGDGLADTEEELIGTSVRLKDTDGDGFSDFQEVIEFGFNPDNNNFRFNPLIADVVKLGIEVTSAPDLSIDYQLESGQRETISVTRERSQATSETVSNTSSNSRAVEETHTAGVEVSSTFEASLTNIGGSATASASYDFSRATSSESTVGYTQEQSRENTQTLAQAEAFESSNSYSETGGSLSLALKVRNDSDLSFQVKSVRLGAVTLDSADRRALRPVANLDIDTSFGRFSEFTLSPNAETDNLNFSASLPLDAIKGLLRDPRGLIVRVASSEIVDSNGVAYAFRDTEIGTKTASVLIDYAGLKSSERYLVATNVDQETGRVSVTDVLSDILKIPYTLNTDGQLESLRDQQSNPEDQAYWVAVHVSENGFGQPVVTEFYSTRLNPDAFSDLELKSGDTLALNFMIDEDEDGVGLRSERLFGSDPNNPDTDADGLPDGVELNGFDLEVLTSNGQSVSRRVRPSPISGDADGDNLPDSVECDMSLQRCSSNPNSADTDGDRIPDQFELVSERAAYTSLELINFTASASAGSPEPQLSFSLPAITDDAFTYTITREVVNKSEELTFCTLSDGENCSSSSTAIAEDLAPPTNNVVTIADTAVQGIDQKFHYQVYLSVRGSEDILVEEVTLNTVAAQVQVTVTLSSLQNIKCWDAIPFLDQNLDDGNTRDLSCELFGELELFQENVGNPVIAEERNSGPLAVVTGGNPESGDFKNAVVTFTVPDTASTCIYIKPRLWEKEDLEVDSNLADDRLYNAAFSWPSYKTAGSVHCQSQNNWNQGKQVVGMKYQRAQDQFVPMDNIGLLAPTFQFLINTDSETYEGLAENLELEVVYNVQVVTVQP